MIITLNSKSFNSGTADGNGTQWLVTDMKGWDSAGVRQSVLAPTSAHGQVITNQLFDSRAITIEGIAKATNEANFWTAYNEISTLLANCFNDVTMTVAEGSITKAVAVRLSGQIKKDFIGVGAFKFSIPLLAADPFKYNNTATGPTVLSASQVATNNGNFDAWPSFEVTTAGSLVLANTTYGAASLTFSVLPLGTIIDTRHRTVLASGTSYIGNMDATSSWFALIPGANTVTKTGTAVVELTYRDTWI